MLFSTADKNAALQIISSVVFWLGYLATRYVGPSESTSTAAHPPRRAISNTTRRAVTSWCLLALLINISYFSVAVTTRKTPADVSVRLWFCATQLFSASYNIYQELRDARSEPIGISAQAICHMNDGAFLPTLCMAADFIARRGLGTSPSLREIAYYAQAPLWVAFHLFVAA